MQTPRFQLNSPFYNDLKKRVNDYFKTNQLRQTGTAALYVKAVVLSLLLVVSYSALVFFSPSLAWSLAFWLLLGVATAGIGFNVMHDGSHGSFSRRRLINKMAAFTLNILGGSAHMWHVKHNIIHHSFTNIEGVDDDIDIQPFLRMSQTQKHYGFHRFQHLYFWLLYAFMYIFWVFYLDFNKYFRRQIGAMALPKMTLREHIVFWWYKVLHIVLFVVLPIYTLGFVNFIIGYLLFNLVTGFVISIIFQLAHTVETTHFPEAQESGKMETDWATHQILTTANFATGNRLISWLVGGLNFQVEHHLFPHVSHIHYPAISKIVKQTCQEYGLPYFEFVSFRKAVASHFYFLKAMGRNAG